MAKGKRRPVQLRGVVLELRELGSIVNRGPEHLAQIQSLLLRRTARLRGAHEWVWPAHGPGLRRKDYPPNVDLRATVVGGD
eukprot:4649950-Lingulodinium_polyedra.AAC.1